MSFTRTVPVTVPSLTHTSLPCSYVSATKKSLPFPSINCSGDPFSEGSISFTMTVPVTVPSVFQSSGPCVSSLAEKNIVPPDSVR
jgi:hypothetical protein